MLPREAMELLGGLRRLVGVGVIVLESGDRYLYDALEIALEQGIAVYDSLHIAQAMVHGELYCNSDCQSMA